MRKIKEISLKICSEIFQENILKKILKNKIKKQLEIESNYVDILSPLQVGIFNMKLENGTYVHHYGSRTLISSGILNGVSNRQKIIRLAQEEGNLISSLPISFSSSVFVRVDEDRMDLLQALIVGPSGTPYDSGIFQFDIFFPPEYPNGPPLVNLQTTGGGTVRFNPNLYNCGKVCLSLLGTWSGGEGETWNKDTSTLLQVLVSIQSFILVTEPYFNEPGYERQINTRAGEEQSKKYNEVVQIGNIEFSMLGQLKKPPRGFEEVVKNHFYLKKEKKF